MFLKLLLTCAISFLTLSVLTMLLILPNIEQSREEARNAQAYILAQQIKSGAISPDTLDPWGNKFDIKHADDNELIVISRGSNMVTRSTGYDSDDISTSMSDPPHRQSMQSRRTRLLFILGLAALPWLLLLFTSTHQRSHADVSRSLRTTA